VTGIPENPDAFLTREATAAALTAAGFPVSKATLATKATRGGGPPYRLFGPKPLYPWGTSLQWAKDRLTSPRVSTSEADAASGHIVSGVAADAAKAGTAMLPSLTKND
jgi:hypothetical protein